MKKRKNALTIAIILLLVVGVTVGYSLLNSTLNINGLSKIGGANWNVHFNNVNITKGSVAATKEPVLDESGETLSVSYEVDLRKPGDFYEFTIDVVNDGAVDAKLLRTPGLDNDSKSQLNLINEKITEGQEDIVKYSITSIDDLETSDVDESVTGMNKNTIFKAKTNDKTEKITYKIRVEYNENITNEQMVKSTGEVLSLKTVFDFEQA